MIKYTLELNSNELYMLQSAMAAHIGNMQVDLQLANPMRNTFGEMIERITKCNALLDDLYKGM